TLAGETYDLCVPVRSGISATAYLWRIAALRRYRLAVSLLNWFAACSGAPSHRLPQGSGQGIVAGQFGMMEVVRYQAARSSRGRPTPFSCYLHLTRAQTTVPLGDRS